ncbi:MULTISPECIES: DUF413 domain-containing protein [Alishewanella]|uniref:Macrodomain Ori protein n=1 Tax=Alishewanella aestuarii B11 TaxID=1197174 RepID=J1PZS9_9ALTE|nr:MULTISPECIES: DUF413 domain-containing protein [Alishewanella]EJI84253.1 hypothetical protein AEST_30870 [Alishewanella aestuarii B11]OCW96460.1 hypothetical protein A9165_11695 [Alishewanella sp. HH-ZS]
MQQSFVANRRFFDDRNFPRGFTRSGRFTLAEGNLLEKHGLAMQELEQGVRQPANDEEQRFLLVCRGEAEANTVYEKTWLKYKQRLAEKRKFHTVFGKKRIADGSDDFSYVESDAD